MLLMVIRCGSNEVVTVNVALLLGRLGEGWQLLTAGAFITMMLPLVVFFSLQRFFVRGLTAGSVKAKSSTSRYGRAQLRAVPRPFGAYSGSPRR